MARSSDPVLDVINLIYMLLALSYARRTAIPLHIGCSYEDGPRASPALLNQLGDPHFSGPRHPENMLFRVIMRLETRPLITMKAPESHRDSPL